MRAVAWILAAGMSMAGPYLRAAGEPQFNRDVRPILSEKCFACHGFDAKHREADFRLDTLEGGRAITDSDLPGIKPGSANDSEVWRRIITEDKDDVMPPLDSHKALTTGEKDIIRKWIESGANYEKHWAFIPPVRAVPPGNGNPVDAFLRERLKRDGLDFSAPADKETLLRRVTLDLTGLPPSEEELDAFLKDGSEGAYEQVVDRLLGSVHYGERMASDWLDVARYGDTNGYLHDSLRTGWPWRDWVIKAFSENMPYDQFVIEQLAGDLLPDATPDQILATAFNRNHLITTEGGSIAAEFLNEYSADRAQTAGTAFMALTFNCCRCHDHKFDPLPQEDFYSMQAYFNSITEKHAENSKVAAHPPFIEIASPLSPTGPKAKVMVMQEAAAPTPTYILDRGQYDQPDKARPVTRHPPSVLGPPLADAPDNRLGLARWMVSPQNTLLARVTVNRLWQQFFGLGIVRTADDFGMQGEYPVHPELLDWLALEFREGGNGAKAWDLRHMVRLIVTSSAYRQSSRIKSDVAAKDPDNRLLSWFPRRRLTAEELRDQALSTAGLISKEAGGAPVFPYQPPGLWEERSNEGSNTKSYQVSTGTSLYRRSLYTFWKRTAPHPFMTLFDAPDRTGCSVRRAPTNTPLQALAMLNDEQILECSKQLATLALRKQAPTSERLSFIFRSVTAKSPTPADLATLTTGLASLMERFQTAPADAAELLKQGASPVDASLNAPELAAWMLIASTVYDLDQTIVRD